MTPPGSAPHEVVELRVHGVHGTPPAEMLGVEPGDVRQVAGDNLTGVYRSKSGELPYRDLTGSSTSVEAYSWGTLTSGVRGVLGWVQRALWLLLLPFALANLAYWARLDLGGKTAASRSGVRFTRLGALLLTEFMVLIPAMVGINLVAWQCYRGDSPGCDRLPGLLDFMADLTASQRLAVGSVLPLAFVAVLWFLSRQSLLRYEEVTYTGIEGDDGRRTVLRHPRLWSGKARTQQLQRVHLTVALAVVVGFSGYHVVNHKIGGGGLVWASVVVATVPALLASLWALVLHPDDVEYDEEIPSRMVLTRAAQRNPGVYRRAPRVLFLAACAATVFHLLALWGHPADLEQRVDFVGDNTWFIAVFVALTAVHLALFTGERMPRRWSYLTVGVVVALAVLAVLYHLQRFSIDARAAQVVAVVVIGAFFAALGLWQIRSGKVHSARAWNGAGASVMLAAAAWIALLFTTGAVVATANYLNGGDHGVDDLVSKLAEDSTATEVVEDASEGAELAATGDVVLRDAVITLDGPGPVLRSGTVEAERLFDVSGKSVVDAEGVVALQKGRTRLNKGSVVLETDRVRIQDSCVRLTVRSTCSPESSRFLVGGMLQVPPATGTEQPPRLRIDSAGDGVEMTTTSPPSVPLVVPQVLIWAPLAQTIWLALTALWLLVALLLFRRAHAAIDAVVERDGIDVRDRAACIKARRRAAFGHRAERLLDGIGVITSVLAIVLIVLSATGKAPWERYESLRPFATVGMYAALATGLGIVLLFSRVRTSEVTRKAVGVIWDLTTFWPRAAHPLAPPCYAERVVPELRTRVDWVLHYEDLEGIDVRAGNRVVLSGHSQGSAILCAVLSRLPREDLGRTRVITYGSQIRALYGRIFPAVFGPDQIGYEPTPRLTTLSDPAPDAPGGVPADPSQVQMWRPWPDSLVARVLDAGGAWVNLFRRSDPLGFRVFSDFDLDPDWYVPEVPDVIVGDAGPRVNTHGGYQHTLVYRIAIAEWTGEQVQLDPVGTTDIPALPV